MWQLRKRAVFVQFLLCHPTPMCGQVSQDTIILALALQTSPAVSLAHPLLQTRSDQQLQYVHGIKGS